MADANLLSTNTKYSALFCLLKSGDAKKTRAVLDNCVNKGYNNQNKFKIIQLGGHDVNSQKTWYRLWKYKYNYHP